MPHIILEYPEEFIDNEKVSSILSAVHQAIADSGLFKANQIRTRAYSFREFSNAGTKKPYIHVQARIKSGRDIDNKKQLGEVILSGISTINIPVDVATVEIIDMERNSYGKYVPN
ncbi:hypothetical protein QUF74_14475 [Candidatus Halobeggiatoa sp. HSG11]|nr:hypothetical protein [Candidatus Halobeggiatoa sp. HSG11]